MNHSSFETFTDGERQSVAFALCHRGPTTAQLSNHRVNEGERVPVRTAASAAFALLATKRLARATKQKFQTSAAIFSESEILGSLGALREMQPTLDKPEALRILAAARMEIAHNPAKYRVGA